MGILNSPFSLWPRISAVALKEVLFILSNVFLFPLSLKETLNEVLPIVVTLFAAKVSTPISLTGRVISLYTTGFCSVMT